MSFENNIRDFTLIMNDNFAEIKTSNEYWENNKGKVRVL